MPKPRQQWAPRPSPLAKVDNIRPVSIDPTFGLVRDPHFWKRFSTAVHITEGEQMAKEADLEKGVAGDKDENKGLGGRTGTNDSMESKSSKNSKKSEASSTRSDWLKQQQKDKRRCRIKFWAIALAVIIAISAGVAVGLYLSNQAKKPTN